MVSENVLESRRDENMTQTHSPDTQRIPATTGQDSLTKTGGETKVQQRFYVCKRQPWAAAIRAIPSSKGGFDDNDRHLTHFGNPDGYRMRPLGLEPRTY